MEWWNDKTEAQWRDLPDQMRDVEKLKDGTARTYTGYQARIDGKWVTAKTYRECNEKIAKAIQEKNRWGLSPSSTIRIGDYADRWYEGHKQRWDPNTRRTYSAMLTHLRPYGDNRVSDMTPSAARRIIANMRLLNGDDASVGSRWNLYKVLNLIMESAVADRLVRPIP